MARERDSRGRYVKAGLVRYVNAKGKESFISPTEKARREGISRFARERTRTDGAFDLRRYRVTVSGYTNVSREPGLKEDRHRGWDYNDEETTAIVESASPDEDYLRSLLDEARPSRRHWDVMEVEAL